MAAGQTAPVENLAGYAAREEPAAMTIAWIGEPLQAQPDALQELLEQGLTPGATVSVVHRQTHALTLSKGGAATIELAENVAKHVFVTAVSPDLPRTAQVGKTAAVVA